MDIIDFYLKKTGKWKYGSWNEGNGWKTRENAFSEDDNFDEAIPIQIRKSGTTEAYKDKINEDIETIDKNENSKQIVQKINGDQYMRL